MAAGSGLKSVCENQMWMSKERKSEVEKADGVTMGQRRPVDLGLRPKL